MDVLGWELVGSGCVGLGAGRQWMCWVDGESASILFHLTLESCLFSWLIQF